MGVRKHRHDVHPGSDFAAGGELRKREHEVVPVRRDGGGACEGDDDSCDVPSVVGVHGHREGCVSKDYFGDQHVRVEIGFGIVIVVAVFVFVDDPVGEDVVGGSGVHEVVLRRERSVDGGTGGHADHVPRERVRVLVDGGIGIEADVDEGVQLRGGDHVGEAGRAGAEAVRAGGRGDEHGGVVVFSDGSGCGVWMHEVLDGPDELRRDRVQRGRGVPQRELGVR